MLGALPASFALYVRSHWLRMPDALLLPHLVRKSWMENVAPLFRETGTSARRGERADQIPQ